MSVCGRLATSSSAQSSLLPSVQSFGNKSRLESNTKKTAVVKGLGPRKTQTVTTYVLRYGMTKDELLSMALKALSEAYPAEHPPYVQNKMRIAINAIRKHQKDCQPKEVSVDTIPAEY